LRQITPAAPPLNAKTQRSPRPPLAPTTNVLELAEQSVFLSTFAPPVAQAAGRMVDELQQRAGIAYEL
jgi:hypothetical protein